MRPPYIACKTSPGVKAFRAVVLYIPCETWTPGSIRSANLMHCFGHHHFLRALPLHSDTVMITSYDTVRWWKKWYPSAEGSLKSFTCNAEARGLSPLLWVRAQARIASMTVRIYLRKPRIPSGPFPYCTVYRIDSLISLRLRYLEGEDAVTSFLWPESFPGPRKRDYCTALHYLFVSVTGTLQVERSPKRGMALTRHTALAQLAPSLSVSSSLLALL